MKNNIFYAKIAIFNIFLTLLTQNEALYCSYNQQFIHSNGDVFLGTRAIVKGYGFTPISCQSFEKKDQLTNQLAELSLVLLRDNSSQNYTKTKKGALAHSQSSTSKEKKQKSRAEELNSPSKNIEHKGSRISLYNGIQANLAAEIARIKEMKDSSSNPASFEKLNAKRARMNYFQGQKDLIEMINKFTQTEQDPSFFDEEKQQEVITQFTEVTKLLQEDLAYGLRERLQNIQDHTQGLMKLFPPQKTVQPIIQKNDPLASCPALKELLETIDRKRAAIEQQISPRQQSKRTDGKTQEHAQSLPEDEGFCIVVPEEHDEFVEIPGNDIVEDPQCQLLADRASVELQTIKSEDIGTILQTVTNRIDLLETTNSNIATISRFAQAQSPEQLAKNIQESLAHLDRANIRWDQCYEILGLNSTNRHTISDAVVTNAFKKAREKNPDYGTTIAYQIRQGYFTLAGAGKLYYDGLLDHTKESKTEILQNLCHYHKKLAHTNIDFPSLSTELLPYKMLLPGLQRQLESAAHDDVMTARLN